MALTKASAAVINTDQLVGYRNKIINGAMEIDQRWNGTANTPNAGNITNFNVDRWHCNLAQSGKVIIQQNAGSVTPPPGFTNYIGITSNSSYAVANTDYHTIRQSIEGYMVRDLDYGKSTAKDATLSFWVRSSLTGAFGGSVNNESYSKGYPFTYTINNANTWEYKTILIPGCTTGTWQTTTSSGIMIGFTLGTGTNYSQPAGTWVDNSGGGYTLSSTGHTSILGTSGATLYLTGVQFEVGTVATPFERRPYGLELALCQRYCQTILNAGETAGLGFVNGSSNAFIFHQGPVSMRGAPSVSYTTTMYATNYSSNLATITGVSAVGFAAYSNTIRITFTLNSSPSAQACGVNPSGGLILLSAEIV